MGRQSDGLGVAVWDNFLGGVSRLEEDISVLVGYLEDIWVVH